MHQGESVETPCCPLWGKCGAAAKGVQVVILSCCHSSNNTPSVRPFGLPAPPTGEPSLTSPERGGGASRRRGFRRYTEYHLENPRRIRRGQTPSAPERGAAAAAAEGCGEWLRFCQDLGEFVQAPLASPGGKLARPVRGVTEEGWRQPKYCLHFVQWYQSQIIADYFPLFKFICHMENGFYKTSTLSHLSDPS